MVVLARNAGALVRWETAGKGSVEAAERTHLTRPQALFRTAGLGRAAEAFGFHEGLVR